MQPGEQPMAQEGELENGQTQRTEEGTPVSDGIQRRNAGIGAPEQTPGMERGTKEGGKKADGRRTRVGYQNLARDLRNRGESQQVSSRELGIENGTDSKRVTQIPEQYLDDDLRRIREKVKADTGMETVFVVGNMECEDETGETFNPRGVYTGRKIIVQVDNAKCTAEQIAAHESFHALAEQDPTLKENTKAAIRERMTQEELEEALLDYRMNLRGIYDAEDMEAENAIALDEFLADAYAGINAFKTKASKYQRQAKEAVENSVSSRGMRSQENGSKQAEGPPEQKFSIEYDEEDKPVVVIDDDILAGVSESKWVSTVKQNLSEKFPNGIELNGETIRINQRSKRELTRSEEATWLMHKNPSAYADKLRATNNTDEIVQSAWNWQEEQPNHSRKDNISSFSRGNVKIRVGANTYTAEVVIGNKSNGDRILYDFSKIKKADAKVTSEPDKQTTDRHFAPTSKYSIDDSAEDVNGQDEDFGVVTNALLEQNGLRDPKEEKKTYKGRSLAEDSEIYSYDFLVAQPDMNVIQLDNVDTIRENGRVNQHKVIENGMENARTVGTERDGKVYVRNSYTGRELRVDVSSIRHGMNGEMNRILTNARLGSVIGDVVQNAIPINALHTKVQDVTGTYAMAGYAADEKGREFVAIVTVEQRSGDIAGVDVYDVTHAVSGRQKRRSDQADTKSQGVDPVKIASSQESRQAAHISEPQGVYPSMAASKISIADLLDVVNQTYQSILSDDVLYQLGEKRSPRGYYSDKVRYSVDDAGDTQETDYGVVTNALLEQNGLRNPKTEESQAAGKAEEKPAKKETKTAEQGKPKQPAEKKQGKKQGKKQPPTEEKIRGKKSAYMKNIGKNFRMSPAIEAQVNGLHNRYLNKIIQDGKALKGDWKRYLDALYNIGFMTNPKDRFYQKGWDIIADGRIYVDPKTAEVLGRDRFAELRKRAMDAGLFISYLPNDPGIRAWNRMLSDELPGDFERTEKDNVFILEKIIQLAEEGRNEHMDLPNYVDSLLGNEYMSDTDYIENVEVLLEYELREFCSSLGIKVFDLSRTAKEREERRRLLDEQRRDREQNELARKILNNFETLEKNRKTMPEDLREVWEDMAKDIDIYGLSKPGKGYRKRWEPVRDMVQKLQQQDPTYEPSERIKQHMARLDKPKIGEAKGWEDIEDLETAFAALQEVKAEFYRRKKLLQEEQLGTLKNVEHEIIREIKNAPGGAKYTWMDKFFNEDQLSPINNARRWTGWNEDSTLVKLFKNMDEGARKQRAYEVGAKEIFTDFIRRNAKWIARADGQGRKGSWKEYTFEHAVADWNGFEPVFADEGVTFSLTPSMRIFIYLSNMNYQNREHMKGGGMVIPDKRLWKDGKRNEAMGNGKTVKMTDEMIGTIIGDMSEEEKALANLAYRYFNEYSTREINKASNELYGYDIARVKNYCPIYTKSGLNSRDVGMYELTAGSSGHLKERMTKAKSEICCMSIFSALDSHMQQMGRYVGMEGVTRDWNALMKVRSVDEKWKEGKEGEAPRLQSREEETVLTVLEAKWGTSAKNYVERLMQDLQGQTVEEQLQADSFVNKIAGMYIGATFAANPSIVLKQLGSIPMQASYLGARNMVKSIPKWFSNQEDIIDIYTPDLKYRAMGYSSPEMSQLTENRGWTDRNKTAKFFLDGGAITAMDKWAARTLWYAAEEKVSREHPDVEKGSEQDILAGRSLYYKLVADEYNEAVAESQSVSDVMHQSTMRRSKSDFVRSITLFKSDSAQTYNTLRRMFGQWGYYSAEGKKLKAQLAEGKISQEVYNAQMEAVEQKGKNARHGAANAVLAMCVNALMASSVDLLRTMWKYGDEDYLDEEGKLNWEKIAKEVCYNSVMSLPGAVAFGEETVDMLLR